MPVGFVAEIPGMTAETYDRVMDNLNWGADNLPVGLISHYACEIPGGMFIFDVWERGRLAPLRRRLPRRGDRRGERRPGGPPQPEFYPLRREEHR